MHCGDLARSRLAGAFGRTPGRLLKVWSEAPLLDLRCPARCRQTVPLDFPIRSPGDKLRNIRAKERYSSPLCYFSVL